MEQNIWEIVNGAMLPQYVGKKVSVTGLVGNVNINNLTFDMRTVDEVMIKVNLRKPYQGVLEGHVEVHGTAQGKTIICDELIQFPLEESMDFDAKAHNTLCTLLHSIPDLWKTSA